MNKEFLDPNTRYSDQKVDLAKMPGIVQNTEQIEQNTNDIEYLKSELAEVPVAGSNLYKEYEYGTGMYEVHHGTINYYGYSSYRYAIIPVKPNTIYSFSRQPTSWILADDSGVIYGYKNLNEVNSALRFLESGNATKLYFCIQSAYESQLTIVEGINGFNSVIAKPSFINDINQRMQGAMYGCALPKISPKFTASINEKWYFENILALPNNYLVMKLNTMHTRENDGYAIVPVVSDSSNGYSFSVYDDNLALVDEKIPTYIYGKAYNLTSCSALVIGDSTVAQNTMIEDMSAEFTAQSKTLTLLGTLGTAPNKHEGRAGWGAKDYCTLAKKDGVSNPFFNPTTQAFDFSYYMTEQEYSAPDFVIVQLGINDLYNANFADFDTAKEQTAGYIRTIIDSILGFNASQKILLNLPTAINSDQTKHTQPVKLVRNKFVRYNEYMELVSTAYSTSNVRCSYCHLILDPTADIRDDVHPTAGGYQKMAMEVISQINFWQN